MTAWTSLTSRLAAQIPFSSLHRPDRIALPVAHPLIEAYVIARAQETTPSVGPATAAVAQEIGSCATRLELQGTPPEKYRQRTLDTRQHRRLRRGDWAAATASRTPRPPAVHPRSSRT